MLSTSELTLSVRGLASRELRDKDLVTRHVTCDSRDKSRQWTRVVKRLEDCHRDDRHNVGIGGHCVRIIVSAPQDEVIKFLFYNSIRNNWQSTLRLLSENCLWY